MRNGILAVAAALVAVVPVMATSGDAPGSKDRGERWAALDADGDGALSLAEAQAGAPRIAQDFARLDADADGKVTREEMHQHRAASRDERWARAEERYRAADANGDGSIDLAEAQNGMPRAAEHFGEIDADGNGLLTREELRAAMHAGRGHHGGGRQDRTAPSAQE